jgi:hypothetical protein
MFDDGSNSAETPRTSSSAPSLNAMGADASVSGQPVVRRFSAGGLAQAATSVGQAAGATGTSRAPEPQAPERTPADDGELFERLVDALEQRVLDELERRGHRHAPGVF